MNEQKITKPSGQIVGYIRESFNGKLEARALDNKLLGTYDPKTNRTQDTANKTICFGNALSALVIEHAKKKGIW